MSKPIEAYTLSDRAIPYYINEASEALDRGDWREALRNLKQAELCEDGANSIGHALRCMAEMEAAQVSEALKRR